MDTEYVAVIKEASATGYQLTVITVCWNALADLKPTVESVQRQKAKGSISIEHVVVDGASTDGTPEWLAEQLAAGNIEQYVSEPDRGIYDAMNKGINMARGEVLAFLNAGDTYTDEDLAPCVLPICHGETYGVAACVNMINNPHSRRQGTSFEQLYFYTPCCHQAYFAAASAYRELGGYDASGFRCCADADVMYRMCRQRGCPKSERLIVANFAPDGFSANCGDDFRHENVELLWRNWEQIEARTKEDRDFRLAMEAFLVNHCYQFRDWQHRHGKRIPGELGKLQYLCRRLAKHAHNLYAKCSLLWFAGWYLPVLIAGRECSAFQLRVARFWVHACYISEDNKYRRYLWLPNKPLTVHPLLRCFFSQS